MSDPLGTAPLREAALTAWRTSPTRLREDANLEEDHARGWYRDRVVVELAQNAADAAATVREPGRLDLRLVEHGGTTWLVAQNTGAALTAQGVASLASLRASTKSGPARGMSGPARGISGGVPGGPDGSARPEGPRPGPGRLAAPVGRFGVGFAAVRSVSDEVVVVTRPADGSPVAGVRFSATATRAALADAGLAAGEWLPVLRLPFPLDLAVPAVSAVSAVPSVPSVPPPPALPSPWATTAVALALRDAAAARAVRTQLDALDEGLLLALAALDVVRVEVDGTVRELDRDTLGADRGWVLASTHGTLSDAALADRGTEDRADPRWSVTWAVPADARATGLEAARGVVHAPTPTAEPLALPGVLVASFPLDATRRHVVEGLAAQEVGRAAGLLLAQVLADLARTDEGRALALVPTGVPAGWVDAVVRDATLDALRDLPLLDGVAPRDAVAIEGPVGADAAVVRALRPVVPGLVTLAPAARAAARRLGVEVRPLADVVDDLAPLGTPGAWASVYDALAPHADAGDVREALATVPVPVGGSVVRGPRGVVVPAGTPDAVTGEALEALAAWGVPVVDAADAHPLLLRLGALAPDDVAVLDLPAARAAVAAAGDASGDPGIGAGTGTGTGLDADADADGTVAARAARLVAVVAAVVRAHPAATLPGLGGVLLPAADRDTGAPLAPQPAADLALPGTWAARVLDLDHVDVQALDAARVPGPVHPSAADASAPSVPAAAFVALGVSSGLRVLRLHDVVLPGPDDDPADALDPAVLDVVGDDVLDHLDALADVFGPGTLVPELDVVVPLDALDPADTPDATGVADVLAHVLTDPELLGSLLTAVRPAATVGRAPTELVAPSHLAWWLRRALGAPLRRGGGVLLPPVPSVVAEVVHGRPDAEAVWAALGVVGSLAELDDDALLASTDRLPPAGTPVPMPEAVSWWAAVRAAAARGVTWDPAPDRVVALVAGGRAQVRDASEVRVGSGPHAVALGPLVPAAPVEVDAVADALDLDVHADDGAPDGDDGTWTPLAAEVVELATALGTGPAPAGYVEHEHLAVAGAPVQWWPEGSGEGLRLHAATLEGVARALAWSVGEPGAWPLLAEALTEPDRVDETWADLAWGRGAS